MRLNQEILVAVQAPDLGRGEVGVLVNLKVGVVGNLVALAVIGLVVDLSRLLRKLNLFNRNVRMRIKPLFNFVVSMGLIWYQIYAMPVGLAPILLRREL